VELRSAEYWLDAFLDGSELFPFKVSIRAAIQLREYVRQSLGENPQYDHTMTAFEASVLILSSGY
jgi:hypothetical protein